MASYESYPEKPQTPPEDPSKRRLRTTLGIAVAVLLVIAVLVGVMVWRNGSLGNARPSDTESLNQSTAGISSVSFAPVELEGLPECSALYGKTLAQIKGIKGIKGSKLAFEQDAPVAAGPLPQGLGRAAAKATHQASAQLKGAQGVRLTVYFKKSKAPGAKKAQLRAVGALYDFDLDELGVAEAEYSVYMADSTVASSLLRAVGLPSSTCSKELVASKVSQAGSVEDSGMRSCTIEGDTGAKLAKKTVKKKTYSKKKHAYVTKKVTTKVQTDFMGWQLVQAYRYGAQGETTRSAQVALS